MYIPKIEDLLKILTDDEVKYFVVINFDEYSKSLIEKLYSKLSKKQSLIEVDESFYIFLATPDEVENTCFRPKYFIAIIYRVDLEIISNNYEADLRL